MRLFWPHCTWHLLIHKFLTPLHLALTNALFWPHCTCSTKLSKCPHELRKHITIVHDENLSNLTFVIKYLKDNINWESILQLFMMRTFKCDICGKILEWKYELRKHITIVYDENLSNVTFVIKYLKENINWESTLFYCK